MLILLTILDIAIFLFLGKLFFDDWQGVLDSIPSNDDWDFDNWKLVIFILLVAVTLYGEFNAFGGQSSAPSPNPPSTPAQERSP